MGMKDNASRVPIDEIREVQDLMDIKRDIDRLKADNPEVFDALADLVDRYNSQWGAAEKAVRARDVTCGPFVNYSTRVNVNFEKMHDELGEDDFLRLGGTITEQTVFGGNQERVLRAVESEDIPREASAEFVKVSRNFRKPDKMAV